jgi:hypothetical protein
MYFNSNDLTFAGKTLLIIEQPYVQGCFITNQSKSSANPNSLSPLTKFGIKIILLASLNLFITSCEVVGAK